MKTSMKKLVPLSSPTRLSVLIALPAAIFLPEAAHALAAPATGTFAYDVYDVAVNKLLKGPIGFVVGLALIVFGATQLLKSWMVAILGVLAGTILVKADAIVVSLGALI